MKTRMINLVSLLAIIFLFSACAIPSSQTPAPVNTKILETNPPDVNEPTVVNTEVTVMTVAPTQGSTGNMNPLPPEPQQFNFQAVDGTMLEGVYYPAAVNPAPLVVMMHWVNGDMHDWNELAVWLQNRGQKNPFPNPGDLPWWDPSWFPKIPADQSYGVFLFTFRGCKPMNEKGCDKWDIPGWVTDFQGAMLTAYSLDGVDTARIVTIGSSIGADGAADACLFLNQENPNSCKGALSLSPGSYLAQKYPNVIERLGKLQPQVAAWCLADSVEVGICKQAITDDNALFQYFEIPNGDHGNMLLRPALEPLPMQLILDFLAQTTK
jgi:hypothetical protein